MNMPGNCRHKESASDNLDLGDPNSNKKATQPDKAPSFYDKDLDHYLEKFK